MGYSSYGRYSSRRQYFMGSCGYFFFWHVTCFCINVKTEESPVLTGPWNYMDISISGHSDSSRHLIIGFDQWQMELRNHLIF